MTVQMTTLDQLLPRITKGNGIGLSKRDGFQVVDYVWAKPDMFTNPHEFECRGLKFDLDGQIIARPLHKFFAVGEYQALSDIDWTEDHVVLDWLDGELIHPCPVEDRLVLMGRSGRTDASRFAETIAPVSVWSLSHDLMAQGITPIFVLVGPDFQSIVPYSKPQLTLIAARETQSGRYVAWDELKRLADGFGVSLVRSHGKCRDPQALVNEVKDQTNSAGYIVAFDNGHRVKVMTDWYALRRKAKSGTAYEKTVLEWVCQGAIDDVLDILPAEMARQVEVYYTRLLSGLDAQEAEIEGFLLNHASAPRRDIALAAKDRFHPLLQKAVWFGLDGQNVRDGLMKLLEWASHSESRIAQIRELLGINPSQDLRQS